MPLAVDEGQFQSFVCGGLSDGESALGVNNESLKAG
jgi:hypothetical protein